MKSTLIIFFLLVSHAILAQDENVTGLKYTKWSKEINVPDPVAISVADDGRIFVTQTTRRKANDLDIRNNRDWIVNDVSFQSVEEKKAFYLSRLSPEFSEKNKRRVKDLNGDGLHDYRDLQQLSEKIHLLEDRNGDGFGDSIQTFADGFNTEVTGIAAGVLHFKQPGEREAVFATIAPDVWRLEDRDGDGVADVRKKIATGFGLHIAYAGHDMHGLVLGPDGKIYWSIGDKGISVTTRDGEKFHFPNQGGVMRCDPDGSNFEVFAHGLRNVQEIAFDQYGNLFGVDNDSDQPGERERFVYIVKGMDAGWRCNYQYRGGRFNPWTQEKLWQKWHAGQPAYIVPPIDYSINGPCGFAFNPGTALDHTYRNHFFLTGAPHGEQIAFKAETKGASFQMKNVHPIGKGVALIGICFGPDGALYGVDWANGYPLNQKGAVWKIDWLNGHILEYRDSTQKMLNADVSELPVTELERYLGYADQRVRIRAQFELVRRKAEQVLNSIAMDRDQNQLARIHAIWGLGQMYRKKKLFVDWEKLLRDDDPEIQVQTLRFIADIDEFEDELLIGVVDSDSKRVLFFLLQALEKHGNSSWQNVLTDLGSRIKPDEVYLRHALSQALAGCGVSEHLEKSLVNGKLPVRLATVVALRRVGSPRVKEFLADPETDVRDEAARAIHDDFSIPEALSDLAKSLDVKVEHSDVFLRRALNANNRLGKKENLERLLRFLGTQDHFGLKVEVMDWIAKWESPRPLDAVTGRFRKFGERKLDDNSRRLIEKSLIGLLSTGNGEIQTACVRTLGELGITLNETGLLEIIKNPAASESLAVESLNRLSKQKSSQLGAAIQTALKSEKTGLRLAGIKQLSQSDPAECLKQIKLFFNLKHDAAVLQKLVQIAAKIKSAEANTFLNDLFAEYVEKNQGGGFVLELADAIKSAKNDPRSMTNWNAFLELAKNNEMQVGEFQLCLDGGDIKRGKRLFETHIDAQCTRCHRVGKTGSTVGPPLDGISKKRKPLQLLNSIVNPSAEIEKEFQTILVALYSGQSISGVRVEENDKFLILADAMGKKIKIDKEDIEQKAVQKKSLMPDLKKSLSKREIRDLVAYLKSLK